MHNKNCKHKDRPEELDLGPCTPDAALSLNRKISALQADVYLILNFLKDLGLSDLSDVSDCLNPSNSLVLSFDGEKWTNQNPGETQVNVNPIVTDGELIAIVTVNGTPTNIYSKGTNVVVSPRLTTGVDIASILIGNVLQTIKAPDSYTKEETDDLLSDIQDSIDSHVEGISITSPESTDVETETLATISVTENGVTQNYPITISEVVVSNLASGAFGELLASVIDAILGGVSLDYNTLKKLADGKADKSDTYTKLEIDRMIEGAGNFNPQDYYDKEAVNELVTIPEDYEESPGEIEAGDSVNVAISKLHGNLLDNELTISAALNDLNSRINNVKVNLTGADIPVTGYSESTAINDDLNIEETDSVNDALGKLQKLWKDDEQVTAAAIGAIKKALLLDQYLTFVPINKGVLTLDDSSYYKVIQKLNKANSFYNVTENQELPENNNYFTLAIVQSLTDIPMISGNYYTWETSANNWVTYLYVGGSENLTDWATTANWKLRFNDNPNL